VKDVQGIPKLLDFGDMDSQKWLIYSKARRFPSSFGYLIEGMKLQRAEVALARKFDFCTCTTRAELQTLDSYETGVPSGWFANGVDTEVFQPTNEPYDPDTICFIGRMDYYPNQRAMLDFCKLVLPLLRTKRPGIKLLIVGAKPPSAIRALAKIPGVTVTGSVPDVRSFVLKSTLSVAPITIARGTQNKIIESMAMGVPVISSEQAAGGVDAIPGEHFLVARTPNDYRDAVLQIMESRETRVQLGHAGRERVLSHHNWTKSMEKLDTLIAECQAAARHRRSTSN
jgi:sugar transferase (PEP-CTERM/EpsH1 system associated)